MSLTPSLTPQTAAKVLAAWWDMAGVEPFDLDEAVRRAQARLPKAVGSPQSNAVPKQVSTRAIASPLRSPVDALADAQRLAAACTSIEALHKAVASFEGCGLKGHARNLVFSDGKLGAPIMVIGEAPDRHDDEAGISFSGPSGELLDKMLASIGLSRRSNIYLSNMIPWRPPGDRKPTAQEIAICKPFIDRHIELAAPKAILLVGGLAAQTLLSATDSVMKLRAKSFTFGQEGAIYAQCLLSPAYLLNRPIDKMHAWRDLLRFRAEISVRGVAIGD